MCICYAYFNIYTYNIDCIQQQLIKTHYVYADAQYRTAFGIISFNKQPHVHDVSSIQYVLDCLIIRCPNSLISYNIIMTCKCV